MPDVVLDASAVLALLFDEPGAERVVPVLERSILSTVNWAEVWQRCRALGADPAEAAERLVGAGLDFAPLSTAEAELAGELRARTERFGLSLADRCCLALAIHRQLPVLTSDATWVSAGVGADIVVIR